MIMENELAQNSRLEADILSPQTYPYKPDIILGYKGKKIGLFVTNEF
jgi:hypothetical protein